MPMTHSCLWPCPLQADRLSDELCEAQAALQHSAELQQLRSSALAALLKRQAKAAGWEHQQQLALAVFAAWQRQANRQVRGRRNA